MADLRDKVRESGFVRAIDGSLGHKITKFVEDYGFLAGPYRPYVDMVSKSLVKFIG